MTNAQEHMIRFIDSDYRTLFTIPDGASITLTFSDGKTVIRRCKFLDEYHTQVGQNVYHICEFAERMERNGTTYAPEKPLIQKTPPAARMAHLESAFFNAPEDGFAIYQLRRGEETRDLRFEPLERVRALGQTVDHANYDLIYTAPFSEKTDAPQSVVLDTLYTRFNVDRPKDFTGHSLSTSDVVALKQAGAVSFHYVDRFGFVELPAFLADHPLKSAEMAKVPASELSFSERLKAKPPRREHPGKAPTKSREMER